MYRQNQSYPGQFPHDEVGQEIADMIRRLSVDRAMRNRTPMEEPNKPSTANFGGSYGNFRQTPIEDRTRYDPTEAMPFGMRHFVFGQGGDPADYLDEGMTLQNIIQEAMNQELTSPLANQLGARDVQRSMDPIAALIGRTSGAMFDERFPDIFVDTEMQAPGSGLTPEAIIASMLGNTENPDAQ